MTTTYSIDDGHGNQITTGLSAHIARSTAQRMADERGEAVTLYSDDEDGEEIEPTEIVVEMDSPNGPRVTYGAQDAATVEAEIPEGWTVDWSSAVSLAASGTHAVRYAAPLVRCCECGEWSGERCQWSGPSAQMVAVEYMPEQHRASHEAAGNRGSYPRNGARRLRVSATCAALMIKHDGDWCEIIGASAQDEDEEIEDEEIEAIIEERGNGLADPGDYVACDGDVYRVVRTVGPIQTGRSPGAPNWVRAMIVAADWSDVDDDNEPACTAKLVTE